MIESPDEAAPPAAIRSDPALTVGMAAIVRMAYEGVDLNGLWNELLARVERDATDAAALMDLSTILQVSGQREQALEVQAAAIGLQHCYHRPHGQGNGLRVLALMVPGDFMANTPIDFLLEGTDVDLWLLYVDPTTGRIADAPEHDVAFLAIGESAANASTLALIPEVLAGWTGPVVNRAPEAIAGLTRDRVYKLFADEPSILAPTTVRTNRDRVEAVARGEVMLADLLPGGAFPIIIRPVDTHAGIGLEKVSNLDGLAEYLVGREEAAFYLAPFIDYSGPDGLFRKQRIAFIDGRGYPSHFAVSEHWMVHYLSAQMTERPERRAEEEAWMRDFDSDFAARHAQAFAALHRQLGLDYFGIDCAETPDGRLLLFEADVAMIVHDLDPDHTFPYKKPAMRRLFDAFAAALQARAA